MPAPGDRDRRKAQLSPAKRKLLEKRLAAQRKQSQQPGDPQRPAAAPTAIPPRSGPGPFPLSFGQERFWLLEQLEPGSPAHNLPYVSRLTGTLDLSAFHAAIAGLIERHEVFRTTFRAVDGVPMQVVAPELDFPLTVIDLADFPAAEREAQRIRLLDEAQFAPFDLERGPLSRVVLLRHHDTLHEMVVCQHHILNDGLGIQYLGQDFGVLYAAAVEGREPPLPVPAVQSKDWACWQRETLRGEVLERGLDAWRRQLADLPTLDLPRDRTQRHEGAVVGARERLALPPELVTQLKHLARTRRATLFMTLLAAFKVVLARLTDSTDIVVGTPVAGRTRDELRRIPGFFLNSLVLRTDLSGAPSFGEVLDRVRRTSLWAQDHQEIPFELVLEAVQPERHLDRSPLFQVMFDYVDFVTERSELPGLSIESEGTLSGSFYDLTLYAWVSEAGVTLEVEYDAALFEASTARRMLARMRRLLEAGCEQPECAIDRLPLMDGRELADLEAWGRGPAPSSDMALAHRLFAAAAQRTPEATALIVARGEDDREGAGAGETGAGRLSYGSLDAASNRLAHRLRELGVGPEVLVGVCLERGADVLVALLAIWKAGGAYVPLDPGLPRERMRFLVEDTQLKVVLTHENVARSVVEPALAGWPGGPTDTARSETGSAEQAAPVVLCLDREAGALAAQPATAVEDRTQPGHLAYVIYTSGSTGQPKGVMIEHRALANHLAWVRDEFRIAPADRLLLRTPLGFDASVWELVHGLVAGATLVIAPPGAHQDVDGLLNLAADHGITVLQSVPSLLRVWVDEPRFAQLSAVRHLICAGEALPASLVDRVHARAREYGLGFVLHNLYGPSEACIDSSSARCTAESVAGRDTAPIGRPATGVHLAVLDAHGLPVPVGAVGEIHVGGAGLARGYLRRPELTAEAFIDDPQHPGHRLYRTGDLGRWLASGQLESVGRRDHQVKVSGYRIEPGEIEATLERHPGVRHAVVVARTMGSSSSAHDPDAPLRLVAYIVPHDVADAPASHTLRAFLASSLPAHMLPAAWVTLDQLPLNANQKVDRAALPPPDAARPEQEQPELAPRTPLEERLAETWRTVLGLDHVGVHDDFFRLGGSSLLATQLASRLRAALGVPLPLRQLFEAPTIAGLAQALEQDGALAGGDAPIAPGLPTLLPRSRTGQHEAPPPLSHAQQRLWFLHRLDPASPAYNLATALRLSGPLDVAALHAALNGLEARHEILRTTFAVQDGEPVQLISPPRGLSLEIENAGGAEPPWPRARALARLPFDLGAGPLTRAHLLVRGPDEHWLIFVQHHIVTDGWSLGVALRELTALYHAAHQGRDRGEDEDAALPAPTLQAADVALWQRASMQGELLRAELDHWRGVLDGAPLALELPSDHPRSAQPSQNGRRLRFPMSAGLSDRVRTLARSLDATLYDTLLAAFAVLLERLSGQEDLVLGTAVAQRNRLELEGVLGFFVNTLPMRVDMRGAPSFKQLVARVHARAIDAWAHQDLPFEQLVDELHPARDLSRAPIVQVAFGVDNLPDPPLELDGLEVSALPLDPGTAKLDLNLTIETADDSLVGALEYCTDLFEEATITRWWSHFITLLTAAVEDPEAPLHTLPVLEPAELRHLAVLSAGPIVPRGADDLVPARFVRAAARDPQAVAIIDGERRLSYGVLAARVDALAEALRARGVGPEVLVGVAIPRSTDYVVAVLATWAAGGAVLPLDVDQPAPRARQQLVDAGVELVLVADGRGEDLAADSRTLLDVSHLPPTPAAAGSEGVAAPPSAEQLAYVLFTSGSTGRPKGVEVCHGALASEFAWYTATLGASPADRFMAHIPAHFDAGFLEWIPPLVTGGSLVMVAHEDKGDPSVVARLAAEHGVTILHEPPPLLEALLREPDIGRATAVRHLTTGGDLLDEDLLPRLFDTLPITSALTLYGPTESCIDVSCQVWTRDSVRALRDARRAEPSAEAARIAPIGVPHDNVTLHLVDARDRLVPPGVPGEILIAGAQLARGYRGLPRETARAFTQDPFGPAGARVYRTGDQGRWRPDGILEFAGRLDQQLKVSGQRIEPGEVEAALLGHEGVRDAYVTAREDRSALLAWVGMAPRGTGEAMRQWLAERLPAIMVPARIVVLDELPRLATGKVDRSALPTAEGVADARADEQAPVAAPRHELEAQVLAVFAQLLDVERLGVHDDFFARGGNSLLALKLVARIEEVFGVSPALRDLFEAPTPAQVAMVVGTLLRGGSLQAMHDQRLPDLWAEAELDADIVPTAGGDDPARHATRALPAHVFLTGATGFLGAHVLSELLTRSEAAVYCLVRADGAEQGAARLAAVLERYGLLDAARAAGLDQRVQAVPGDLGAPRLGLSVARFDELATTLDAIIHSGASVDFFKPYASLAAPNVGGTREVLKLACQTRPKSLHHVSTIGVIPFGQLGDVDIVRETDPLLAPDGLEGGYEQSKWVAEQLVHAAAERGLPVSIHRPGRVSASATTGRGNPDDMASRVFTGCVTMGAVPDLDGTLDITPVDYCAAALVHLAFHGPADGRVYHLVNPRRSRMADAYDVAEARGFPVRRLPYADWYAEFVQRVHGNPSDPAYPLLPLLAPIGDDAPDETAFLPDVLMPELGWENVREGLAGSGIVCPVIDAVLIARWMEVGGG